jgi:hypothetical protein
LNAKIPIHIVRYEDLVSEDRSIIETSLKGLLEFILNIDDITGTKVDKFLKIAISE